MTQIHMSAFIHTMTHYGLMLIVEKFFFKKKTFNLLN